MRPKKDDKQQLSVHVIIRLKTTEKDEIVKRMNEERFITITDYVRSRLFIKRLSKRITVSDEYIRIFRTLDFNLTKIGNNLNQIAHKLNAYNTYMLTEQDKLAFESCFKQLKSCFEILDKYLHLIN
ncbi:plasmid mobilization relaxosome protein MobC [Carboxylicivirga marina]|uniref:Plasmid mobilization relaxosome protein MobC n=1 Tax=Carboxylicivirga marina TaxID=2800988 RepID=A0ABS1HKX9_9BACT|nr:plasmid mobilization relaxosome protein MobC [Carboxylicivirga marina]MBK3518266.1 plasmid mobilization relaxosome protein MobC [Carboxylicivirga marina]